MNTGVQHINHGRSLVRQAVAEVEKMEKDPTLKKLMAKAKGIYLVPEFGRGASVVGGRVAFLLMDKSAIDACKSGNKIALNAGAGLSIVIYSANAQVSWGKGDIIMRSDTAGAYAGATVSVTDINRDDDTSKAYDGRKVDPANVLAGKLGTPRAQSLKQELPS